jgi:hypothetical protein
MQMYLGSRCLKQGSPECEAIERIGVAANSLGLSSGSVGFESWLEHLIS